MAQNLLTAPVAFTKAVFDSPALVERTWQRVQRILDKAEAQVDEMRGEILSTLEALQRSVDTTREVFEGLAPTLERFESATRELTRAADEVHQTNVHIERLFVLLEPLERAQNVGGRVAQRLLGGREAKPEAPAPPPSARKRPV